jgi:hypothetical protein
MLDHKNNSKIKFFIFKRNFPLFFLIEEKIMKKYFVIEKEKLTKPVIYYRKDSSKFEACLKMDTLKNLPKEKEPKKDEETTPINNSITSHIKIYITNNKEDIGKKNQKLKKR